MNIKANEFKTRQDIESYISSVLGRNVKMNNDAGHTITGKKEELKRLRLSDTTNIWGVKCEMTDETPEKYKKHGIQKKTK